MKTVSYYIYKCVVDDGGAPCVYGGRYSLSICKPAIRRTADEGDVIFAFGSNSGEKPANRLVYIAVVSKVVREGAYYELRQYARRPDCIYCREPDREFVLRDDARFHTKEDKRSTDLGQSPNYANACTLLSDDFRYFGAAGTDEWKASAQRLAGLVENLGQGHRVRIGPELRDELRMLKQRVWRKYPRRKVLGEPLHASGRSETTESDDVVKVCGKECNYLPVRRARQRAKAPNRAGC